MRRRQFRPSLWPTLAALAGICLTVAMGNWQLGRGNEKSAMAERILAANRDALIELSPNPVKADDLAWRRVEVRGRFEPKYGVLIDNRILRGAVGYYVVMPLRIGDSARYVLVNRGWVAGSHARGALPQITTPTDMVRIVGLATVPASRPFELSNKVTEGIVWQNLTLERYREAMPIAIHPVVVRQENDIYDGLKREWEAPEFGVEKHFGYAFQWFALAGAILIFYLLAHVEKRTQ